MSIFKRLSNVIRSNVNEVLDKAEDPKKILDQTIIDMAGEHQKAKKMLLETLTLQKQGEKQLKTYKKQAEDWEGKAMSALKAGNEDLARQALGKKSELEGLIPEAETGLKTQKQYTEELKVSVKRLEEKIEEAKAKRDELVARLNSAQMTKQRAEAEGNIGGDAVGDSSAFDTFDRMAEKIENQEATLEARQELYGTSSEDLDFELEKEMRTHKADDALDALKAKMAESGGTKKADSKPAADDKADDKADGIEDELAALRKKLDG